MPSILNSDDGVVSGTSGLKSTGGNDGLLNIQSNGSTIVAVTGSGISVTGTVSQTGVSTFAAGTASAPSITFTGDTNTGIFSPAADTIAFTEGGVESARFDSSGRLLLGTTTSTNNLRLNERFAIVTAGSATYAGMAITGYSGTSGGARPLFEMQRSRGTTDGSLTKVESGDVIGSLIFRGSDGSAFQDVAEISVAVDGATGAGDTPGRITFATSADGSSSPTERARIPAAGGFQCVNSISVGNATPTTSGAGITFPATQSASSNANTLDDYEEGTWTPAFSTTGTAFSSITYSIQTAYYTKIGNMVYIWGWVTINTVSGGTGNITMTGLPFTNGSMQGGVTTNWADGQWTTRCPDAGHILANSTTVYLIQYGGTQTLQIPVGNAKAGSQWIFNGAYGIV